MSMLLEAPQAPVRLPLPHRRFGKTDERVPMVGLGTGPAGFGMPDDEAISLYHAAIDRGVMYLDTAPGYARAHAQLGEVLPSRRSEVFLVTKAFASTAAELLTTHEQSLKDLRTDQVDLLYSHCIGSYTPEQLLSPEGPLAGLQEARRRGWTRYIGFTAHHSLGKSEIVLNAVASGDVEVDAIMLAMNFADRHTYGFENRILPLAEKLDVGVACMKVYGGAHAMDYEKNAHSQLATGHAAAFRYALGLPGVAVAVIGMRTVEQLEQNIAWANAWEPLTAEEAERLSDDGKRLSVEWGPRLGEVE